MLKKSCFMMMLACLGASSHSFADICTPKPSKKDISILIIPLATAKNLNTATPPTSLIPLLLNDYLGHVDGIFPILKSPGASGDYVLAGSLERKGTGYTLTARLYPMSGDSKTAPLFSGPFEFPSGMNDLLIALTEKIATSLGKKFQEKKVLPYLNRTNSVEAYLAYAEGRLTLPASPDRAVSFFKKAVEKDYNYVPAYLGVAEALARAGAKGHAQRELTKAKLLNPVLTKEREKCITFLLDK